MLRCCRHCIGIFLYLFNLFFSTQHKLMIYLFFSNNFILIILITKKIWIRKFVNCDIYFYLNWIYFFCRKTLNKIKTTYAHTHMKRKQHTQFKNGKNIVEKWKNKFTLASSEHSWYNSLILLVKEGNYDGIWILWGKFRKYFHSIHYDYMRREGQE